MQQALGTAPAREVRSGPAPRPFWAWSLERYDNGEVTVLLVRRGGPVDSRRFTLRDGRNARGVAVGLARAFAVFRGEDYLDEEGRTVSVEMGVVT